MDTHIKTLLLTLGVAVGITIGEKSLYASEVVATWGILFILQFGVWFLEKRNTSDAVGVTRTSFVPIVTTLLALGVVVGIIRIQLIKEKTKLVCDTPCTFIATVISSPKIKNDNQQLVVHPQKEDTTFDIQVRTPLYPRYHLGETVTLTGKVSSPGIIMPHGDSTKRVFDYGLYLESNDIGSEMLYPRIELVDKDAHTVNEYLGRWKEDLITRGELYIQSPASSLASGMLFGSTGMSKELVDAFRAAGLSHIIVLSGFNIAIVITSMLFVLQFVPLLIRIFVASISVVIFVIMVGGEPSVVRATLMAFIGLLALLVGRAYVARQALILSFLMIILYSPLSLLYSVSLHLSFLATAGIVYLSPSVEVIFKKAIPFIIPASLHELIVTTVSAYLSTLPYVMYTFGTVSVYALLANAMVLPFVPFAMLLSFCVIVSSYVSQTMALLLGFLDTALHMGIIIIARTIEILPGSLLTISLSLHGMVIIYVFIIFVLVSLSRYISSETAYRDEEGNLVDVISY